MSGTVVSTHEPNSNKATDVGEFKAPMHVVALGLACAVCLFCIGKAFALKLLGGVPGESLDTTDLMMFGVVSGCVAEIIGAAYLARHRRHGTRSKAGAVLVISVMIMMLLPIQFAVLSIWLNHQTL